jgi:hypothetical protein
MNVSSVERVISIHYVGKHNAGIFHEDLSFTMKDGTIIKTSNPFPQEIIVYMHSFMLFFQQNSSPPGTAVFFFSELFFSYSYSGFFFCYFCLVFFLRLPQHLFSIPRLTINTKLFVDGTDLISAPPAQPPPVAPVEGLASEGIVMDVKGNSL